MQKTNLLKPKDISIMGGFGSDSINRPIFQFNTLLFPNVHDIDEFDDVLNDFDYDEFKNGFIDFINFIYVGALDKKTVKELMQQHQKYVDNIETALIAITTIIEKYQLTSMFIEFDQG